ncbi:MAG: hypothetical protein ACODAU_09640, partial [Myxococcota bacterium]
MARWLGSVAAGVLLLLVAPAARATEPAEVVLLVSGGADDGRTDRWGQRLRRRADEGVRIVADPVADAAGAPGGVAPARLDALARAEALLVQARRHAAGLEEPEALAALAQARRLLEAHADVPGAAAWLAEAHLLQGIVAAHSGRPAVAEQALGAAATLDPGRRLRAAEAAPA